MKAKSKNLWMVVIISASLFLLSFVFKNFVSTQQLNQSETFMSNLSKTEFQKRCRDFKVLKIDIVDDIITYTLYSPTFKLLDGDGAVRVGQLQDKLQGDIEALHIIEAVFKEKYPNLEIISASFNIKSKIVTIDVKKMRK